MLDPDLPNNHGLIRAVEITAPGGTVVNANFPAAVAGRANTSQRVIDVLIGALAQALPERAVAAANGANVTAVFYGHDPRHDRPYVYLETLGGGFGGRATKDGKDGVQVHITNTSNLPVEAIEMEYPLMVESYGLIEDSGGGGRFRGGMGIRRVVRPVDHEAVFSGMGERFVHRPWGLFGGEPGASGQFVLRHADGSAERVGDKPNRVMVSPDEAVVIETPGAGGYGPPAERDAAALAEDRRSGKFTDDYLRATYGDRAGGD
jgi:N-methylhydantoinase B